MDNTGPNNVSNVTVTNQANQTPSLTPPIPVPTPTVYSSSDGNQPKTLNSSTSGKFPFKLLLVIFVLLFLLTVSASGVAAAIAYEKIKINNPELKQGISRFVMSLPFTPKTPRFILESAALAHAKVSKHSFDISLAAKTDDISSSFGLNKLDVKAKGNVDYTDPQNLKVTANASVTKDFNADLRKNDQIVYLKINKFPDYLFTYMNLDKEKISKVFENWIAFDTSSLDTQAREELEKKNDSKSFTEEYVANLADDLLDDKLLPALEVSDESVDDHDSYKIHLAADDKIVDNLFFKIRDRLEENTRKNELRVSEDEQKPSDYIKNLVMDIWVDKSDYYVRKVSITLDYNPNSQSKAIPSRVLGLAQTPVEQLTQTPFYPGIGGLAKTQFAIVVKFDKFGESFTVETPKESLTPDEFYQQVMETSGFGESIGSLQDEARDTVRLSDLTTLNQVINVSVQKASQAGAQTLCAKGIAVPCKGSSVPSSSANKAVNGRGWVKVDISSISSVFPATLPTDPVNDSQYHYFYCSNGVNWELNAVLESEKYKTKMTTDGGDNNNRYEVGSSLTLIDKVSACKF